MVGRVGVAFDGVAWWFQDDRSGVHHKGQIRHKGVYFNGTHGFLLEVDGVHQHNTSLGMAWMGMARIVAGARKPDPWANRYQTATN